MTRTLSDHTAPGNSSASGTGDHHLTGSLGVGSIIFMVIAAASPLTVIAGAAPLGFLLGNGIGFPAMFLVGAGILALFAVGLTTMTHHIPKPGTFFTYIAYGLGRPPGLAAAYLAMLSYTAVQVAVYAYMGEVLRTSLLNIGAPSLPWWVFSAIIVVAVAALGFFRIDLSSKILGILLIGEIGILAVLLVAVTVTGGAQGLSAAPFALPNIFSGAPGVGLMIALSGFIGFEAVTVFRDEAKQPHKTIPRAAYGSVIGIGVFYALVTWSLVMAWGTDHVVDAAADPATMLLQTALQYLGPAGGGIVSILLITSLFACILSLHNVSTRYQHAMAVSGLLPRALNKVHPQHGSPYISSLSQSFLVFSLLVLAALLRLDPVLQLFTWFSGMTPLAIAVLMAMTSVSVIFYFQRHPHDRPMWNVLIAPTLGLLGLLTAIFVMVMYFPMLVGDVTDSGDPAFGATSSLLLGLVCVAPAAGLVQAAVLRARKPQAYQQVTESIGL
jgi:amino acid transporter